MAKYKVFWTETVTYSMEFDYPADVDPDEHDHIWEVAVDIPLTDGVQEGLGDFIDYWKIERVN